MRIRKQGTTCELKIERLVQDGLDLWGVQGEQSFHLGSYQTEMDALDIWMAFTKAEMLGEELFIMPTDYKLTRR